MPWYAGPMWKSLSLTLAMVAASALIAAAAPDPETQRTVEGVRAVEAHWTHAFLGGDGAYLAGLLDPDYVSVNPNGVPRSKDDIIAMAKKHGANPSSAPTPPADPGLHITVHGDAAIATASSGGQASSDVFYWKAGRWHAWYSQHTAVKPAA
jgi:hypothetical protein